MSGARIRRHEGRDGRSRAGGLGMAFATVLGVGATLGTLLGFAGALHWTLDLFAHFRGMYALALIAAAGILMLLQRWPWVLALSLVLVLDLWQLAPLYLTPELTPERVAPGGAALRLVHLNVLTENPDKAAVVRYLRTSRADAVLLVEVDRAWLDAMGNAVGDLRVVQALPRADNFGIALLARPGRVVDARIIDLAGLPAMEATLRAGHAGSAVDSGPDIELLGLHTMPPIGASQARRRDLQLAAAAAWARARRGPHVVLGDLNATPWSHPLRALQAEADLASSQAGFGLQPTWPTTLPGLLRIPIDHALHSRDLVTLDRQTGPAVGSDHLPLEWTIAPAAPAR